MLKILYSDYEKTFDIIYITLYLYIFVIMARVSGHYYDILRYESIEWDHSLNRFSRLAVMVEHKNIHRLPCQTYPSFGSAVVRQTYMFNMTH